VFTADRSGRIRVAALVALNHWVGYSWQFTERAFSKALPWLAEQIQTPGSGGAA